MAALQITPACSTLRPAHESPFLPLNISLVLPSDFKQSWVDHLDYIHVLTATDTTLFKSLNHQNTGSDSPRSRQRQRELNVRLWRYFKIWLLSLCFGCNLSSFHSRSCSVFRKNSVYCTNRRENDRATENPSLELRKPYFWSNPGGKNFEAPFGLGPAFAPGFRQLKQMLIGSQEKNPSHWAGSRWCPTFRGRKHNRLVGRKVCF